MLGSISMSLDMRSTRDRQIGRVLIKLGENKMKSEGFNHIRLYSRRVQYRDQLKIVRIRTIFAYLRSKITMNLRNAFLKMYKNGHKFNNQGSTAQQ